MSTLAPISLAELTAAADLQTRVDRKYVLTRAQADVVLAGLAPDTRVLEIDGTRAMAYESVYFDTRDLLSYRMAAHARRRRFKLRTRSYVDSATSFLEMKTRGARSTTVKERIEYDPAHRDVLTEEGREYADAALDGLGISEPERLELLPTLVTSYRRRTLYLPASGSRATVDTDLSWESDDGTTILRPDLAIIETKSGSRISDVDRLLWSHGHRPDRISKFGTGLAALRPDLPANKWARVLRRHFGV
ncbi:MAG TPA: polyphosphate polymerase domain-containing protein [Rhodoglobus sp.]|nr:polyphosphate polymerase domain-containing protein [Rhodoglobus sp.]